MAALILLQAKPGTLILGCQLMLLVRKIRMLWLFVMIVVTR